jgi:hypothetical protein
MATEVYNPSVEITALPSPLTGILRGGQRIVLSYTPAALEAAVPSIGQALRIRDLGDSYPGSTDDASYGLASGQTVAQSIAVNDAVNNDVTTCMTLSHTTSGTAASGIGALISCKAENAAGTAKTAAVFGGVLGTVTAGSEVGVAYMLPAAADEPTEGLAVRSVAAGVVGLEVLVGATGVAVRSYPYGETNASWRVAGKGTGSFAITNPANSTVFVEVNSTGMGFFGVTPIARPLLATGASATVDNVITVLQNLGLVRQS